MANYYNEARAQVRNLKKIEETNRRRAERRAELATAREDLPVHRLQIDGRSCTIHRDTQEYESVEQMKVMMPWNGDSSSLIDRFDARAMLDFYRPPDPARAPQKAQKGEDREMEERVVFESFRDLVKLVRKGLQDEEGLAYVEDEALDLRVAARSRASLAAGVPLGSSAAGGADAGPGGEVEEEEADQAEDDMIDAVEEDAGALDELALSCGISNFSVQLQRAVVQEEDEASQVFQKRKRISRRKMAERVKRMLGQGLNPFGKSKAWWKDTLRSAPSQQKRERASPDYGGRSRQSTSKSTRSSPKPTMEYIAEFHASRRHDSDGDTSDGDTSAGSRDAPAHAFAPLEARPGHADPAAAGGPVALPAAGSVMHGRRVYTQQDRAAERAREAERSRITMNEAKVQPSVAQSESKQDRLKRLMAAQFNSHVARDTKKKLERKDREDSDRRARAAIEKHALSMPTAGLGGAGRTGERREQSRSPERPRRRSPSASRSPARHSGRRRRSWSRSFSPKRDPMIREDWPGSSRRRSYSPDRQPGSRR